MKLKEMIKVRFNLSRGANYMKWKIEYPDGTKEYLSPEIHRLFMTKALLKNYKKTAQKIFDGGEKVVCAWIMCESIQVVKMESTEINQSNSSIIRYNPRITPNWVYKGFDADGELFESIRTNGKIVINFD
jgi:hypothetical protein